MSLTTASLVVQRKCACGGSCDDCKKKKLQRKSASATGPLPVPSLVHDVLRSPGQPLDYASRSFFEPRFGHNFGNVRVHTDEKAAESARAVNALAYTVGQNVVFDRGQFTPSSSSGRKLLAHELTHVIQQQNGFAHTAPLTVSGVHDPSEHEADRIAHSVLTGQSTQARETPHSVAVQRQTPPPGGMQGPDNGLNCDFSKFPPECKATIGGVDVPLSKDQYRCAALAYSGQCPKECVEVLKETGIPCTQTPKPDLPPKTPSGPYPPILPSNKCKPGETPYMGGCLAPLPKPSPQPDPDLTLKPGLLPRPKSPSLGMIESAVYDNFALSDPAVPSEHSASLDHLASLLNVYSDVTVHIEGHTDGSGDESINAPLSLKRAEAMKAALIARKVVNPGRIQVTGLSSHKPLVKPSTPSAREPRNRRVEVWYFIPPAPPIFEGGLKLNKNL